MDDPIYAPFMELLRAGLWNRRPNLRYFPLSDENWIAIRRVGLKQTVSGIVYDGMLLLPESLYPPTEIFYAWSAETVILEHTNSRMNKIVAELYAIFEKEGIEAMLQKGQGLAALYDVPLHRMSGDIDWYIASSSDRKKVKLLFQDIGVTVRKQAGFSQICEYKGVQVELHSRILDSHNPFVLKHLKELESRESMQAMRLSLKGELIRLPSPLLCHLQVNMHILKHMLGFGIGLRQLCDAARIYYKLSNRTDGLKLEQVYRHTGILKWIQVLNELLCEELGLEDMYLPFARQKGLDYEWMMHEIWIGGNFGFYDKRYGEYDSVKGQRASTVTHWLHRFLLHLRFAPQETFWFPFTHLLSGFRRD